MACSKVRTECRDSSKAAAGVSLRPRKETPVRNSVKSWEGTREFRHEMTYTYTPNGEETARKNLSMRRSWSLSTILDSIMCNCHCVGELGWWLRI